MSRVQEFSEVKINEFENNFLECKGCETANDMVERKIIKDFLKSQRVDVVCWQESKIKDMN